MPRSNRTRLTDSAEFERVYRGGVAFRGKLISMHAFANNAGNPRLGLAVSKKVGNAVTRNAVRRRLREIYRGALPSITAEVDLVVSARHAAAAASFDELEGEFQRALEKLGVI